MKTLLLVTDASKPQVNGVVRVFEKIIEELKEKNIKVILIEPSQFKTISMPGYKEIKLSLFPKKKCLKILEEVNPDFIHIATEGPLGISMRNLCSKKKIPFTTSYHTNFSKYVNLRYKFISEKKVYSFLKWFHNKAEKTLVCTPTIQAELQQMGIAKTTIWPLGIDLQLFKKNTKTKNLLKLKTPIFTYLGRLAPEKNIEEFLKLNLPGTQLVIGDGPERKELEKKYPHVTFVGYKFGQEIVELLSISDVFVFPSKTETFGLVLLEALACELPVAAFNVQGPKDIITQGVDGYLGDNLEEQALKCLTLDKKVCRKTAENYYWEKSAELFSSKLIQIKK